MVLRKQLTFVLLMGTLPAWSSSVEKKVITQSSCPMLFVDRSKQKLVASRRRFTKGVEVNVKSVAGTKILNQTVPKNSNFILIQDPRTPKVFYLGESDCLFYEAPVQASSSSKGTSQYSGKGLLEPEESSSWHFSLLAQTYRSRLTLTFPSGQKANLETQDLGILPQIAWHRRVLNTEWSIGVAALLGRAEVGQSLQDTLDPAYSDYVYRADNIPVYGAEVSFAYYTRPVFKNAAFGIKIPLRWTMAQWPSPGSGYRVSPTQGLNVSYLIENRLERGPVTWVQNFGFYNRWGRVLWSIGLSYGF